MRLHGLPLLCRLCRCVLLSLPYVASTQKANEKHSFVNKIEMHMRTRTHLIMRITMRIKENEQETKDRFVSDRKRNEPHEVHMIQCTLIVFVCPKTDR